LANGAGTFAFESLRRPGASGRSTENKNPAKITAQIVARGKQLVRVRARRRDCCNDYCNSSVGQSQIATYRQLSLRAARNDRARITRR